MVEFRDLPIAQVPPFAVYQRSNVVLYEGDFQIRQDASYMAHGTLFLQWLPQPQIVLEADIIGEGVTHLAVAEPAVLLVPGNTAEFGLHLIDLNTILGSGMSKVVGVLPQGIELINLLSLELPLE